MDIHKIAKVQVSIEIIEKFMRGEKLCHDGYVLETNAPSDLQVVGIAPVEADYFPITAYVYVCSETFQRVAEGGVIPLIEPFIYTQKKVEDNA